MPRRIRTVKPQPKAKKAARKSAVVHKNPTTNKMREIARRKIFVANEPPVDAGQAVMDTMRWIPKKNPVTIFLSGGIDSHICLFAALELGLNINIASFTLDTHESSDFKSAKHAADIYNLPFHPIYLKSDLEHLKKWVLFAVNKLKQTSKASIECAWPLYMGLRAMEGKTKHVVFGLGGDSYFLMAKSQSMHCKDLVVEARRKSFRRVLDQNDLIKREAFKRGMFAHLPFFDDGRMYAELQFETDYAKINSPQKSFLNLAFPEHRKRCKVRGHQNFQLGDTGISDIFAKRLLDSDWNPGGKFKSVVGVYNRVVRGEITK